MDPSKEGTPRLLVAAGKDICTCTHFAMYAKDVARSCAVTHIIRGRLSRGICFPYDLSLYRADALTWRCIWNVLRSIFVFKMFSPKIISTYQTSPLRFCFSIFHYIPASPVIEYQLFFCSCTTTSCFNCGNAFFDIFSKRVLTFVACPRSSESHDRFKVYYFSVDAIRICWNFIPDNCYWTKCDRWTYFGTTTVYCVQARIATITL